MSVAQGSESAKMQQDKEKALQELTEFTDNCQARIKEILDHLGWEQTLGENIKKDPMGTCPYDPNHRVLSKNMERHKTKCLLNQMGYSKDEQIQMYDPSYCYERATIPRIVMDKSMQHDILRKVRSQAPLIRMEGQYSQGDYSRDTPEVPQNHERALCDLTVADRLALYDHVVQETTNQKASVEAASNEDLYVDLVAKLKRDEGQTVPKSHLEVLAEMRDYKRRRQSYRAKNVHITKKSYTEVIREVIDVHSGELAKLWEAEEEEEEEQEWLKREDGHKSARSSRRRHREERRSGSLESHQSNLSSREVPNSRDRKRDQSQELDRDREREGHKHRSRHKRKRSRERSQSSDEDDDDRHKKASSSPEERHHHKKKKKKKKKRKKEDGEREKEELS